MSDAVINHNPDLKRLQDEGYELEVHDGCAIVRNVPYLDSSKTVQHGILVSQLGMSGDTVKYNGDHKMYFQGQKPYRKNGECMNAVYHSDTKMTFAGVAVNMMLSNKPKGNYSDYYEKFTRYIQLLSAEAQAVDSSATAATFRKIICSDDSVFHYADTNASRAAITDVSDKLKGGKIGIIGLGGTGSYILDQVAKTPVSEIHLFDGDIFCQHNAFRAPGAPGKEIFEQQPLKSDYFRDIYANMHRHIFSHPYNLDTGNVSELDHLNFVFLAVDSGDCKRVITDHLLECGISFIDTGIDIKRIADASLIGMARSTSVTAGRADVVQRYISFSEADKDLYQSNVQTADLNAVCAILAVIRWKMQAGFYRNDNHGDNCVYCTNTGECTWA